MDEHVARLQRFNEWLPKFEARLRENRRQMKIYCAIAKLRRLQKACADQRINSYNGEDMTDHTLQSQQAARPTIEELEKILNDPDGPAVEITAAGEVVPKGLRHEIERAVNRVSAEGGSHTPDFILAEYLVSCLSAFDRAVNARERWYGREPNPDSMGARLASLNKA